MFLLFVGYFQLLADLATQTKLELETKIAHKINGTRNMFLPILKDNCDIEHSNIFR